MSELTSVLIKNHERSILALKVELNNLYEKDKKNKTNSKYEAELIQDDITEHRTLIKILQAGEPT